MPLYPAKMWSSKAQGVSTKQKRKVPKRNAPYTPKNVKSQSAMPPSSAQKRKVPKRKANLPCMKT